LEQPNVTTGKKKKTQAVPQGKMNDKSSENIRLISCALHFISILF